MHGARHPYSRSECITRCNSMFPNYVVIRKYKKMTNVIKSFWKDENGFVISTELMIIATILVLGLIVGFAQIRDQLVQELGDVAMAISNFDQSYDYTAVSHVTAPDNTAGGLFVDSTDLYDAASGVDAGGVLVNGTAAQEQP